MHLDGYKYWLAYKKGTKSYYRCSRSKSQKCPGKLIMENSKIISSIPHDHDKESRNNAVEKFRKVLTKKAIEKPNKSLVDIYLEETLNHSEASILYPFAQAESTMRKARSKMNDDKSKSDKKSNNNETNLIKNDAKLKKVEEGQQYVNFKSQQYQKYFYVEDILNEMQVILMNQGTLKFLGMIEEVHIDSGLKGNLLMRNVEEFGNSKQKSMKYKMDMQKCIGNMKYVQDPDHSRGISESNQLFTNTEIILNRNEIVVDSENPNNNQHSKTDQNFELNEEIAVKELSNENFEYKKINCHEIYIQNHQNSNISSLKLDKPSRNYTCNIIPTSSQQVFEHVQFFEHKENEIGEEHSMSLDFEFEKQNFNEINIKYSDKYETLYSFGGITTKNQNFDLEVPQNSNIVGQSKVQMQNIAQINHLNQSFDVGASLIENLVTNVETHASSLTIFTESSEVTKQLTRKSTEIKKKSSVINQNCQKSNGSIIQLHVITIIALIKGRDCPIAFGLLKSIDSDSVFHFLQFVRCKISLNPSIVVTDNNHILQQSIHNIWPEANLKIMYFYYAQSIMKNLNKNFQEIAKNIFEISSLKMILSMPMIPTNYVIPGWEALRKWMSEKNVNLGNLCDEVYKNWLAENAEKVSIFNGLTHSINNHTQIFQSELQNSLDKNQMDINQLIDKISRQATRNFIKFTKTSEHSVKKMQKLQKTVKIATKNWISSPFHLRRPIQFLQQVSHCIDDAMMSFVMNFDGNFCEIPKRSEPPPLMYFVNEKNGKGTTVSTFHGNNINLLSEPPPLVPIKR